MHIKYDVPQKKTDRARLFRKLYRMYADLHTDLERFTKANTHLNQQQSIRTWKRYKAQYDWDNDLQVKKKKAEGKKKLRPIQKSKKNVVDKDTTKKLGRKLKIVQGQYPLPDQVVKPQKIYVEHEKNLIVKTICDNLKNAAHSAHALCESQGISFGLFHKWLRQNKVYMQMYEDAKQVKSQIYIEIFQDIYVQKILADLIRGEEQFVTETFKFVPVIDPDTKRTIQIPILENRTVLTKPKPVDHETIKIFSSALRDWLNQSKLAREFEFEDTAHMSLEALDRSISELESQLEEVEVLPEIDDNE